MFIQHCNVNNILPSLHSCFCKTAILLAQNVLRITIKLGIYKIFIIDLFNFQFVHAYCATRAQCYKTFYFLELQWMALTLIWLVPRGTLIWAAQVVANFKKIDGNICSGKFSKVTQ